MKLNESLLVLQSIVDSEDQPKVVRAAAITVITELKTALAELSDLEQKLADVNTEFYELWNSDESDLATDKLSKLYDILNDIAPEDTPYELPQKAKVF